MLDRVDYNSERVRASNRLNMHAIKAAQYLLYSAYEQAKQYEFDLEASFDSRLALLRKRIGIAEPEQNAMIEPNEFIE